jgi:outer membrane receptor protein involved in Fe transport
MERKRTPASFVPWAAAFLLIALVLPASLHAQETRGRITGRVTDTSKATVPGASVTVTDVARGRTASSTTNDQGLFQVNYLLPGTYTVVVELAGFKKHIQENVLLQISETHDLAIVLEIGGVQETVSVVAQALLLNTTDASLGLIVDQQRLASLPLIHGDPYKIMGLAPGVTHTGDPRLDRPFEPTHIIGYAFDGTRGNRSDLLIDGAPSTATANANEVIATYVPQSDMVQEFKVQTATFDSQFGNTEGGVTSMVIKSGTNRFRGSAYYFAEPYKWGANDYFGKRRGQAIIQSNSNRPGFTVGGPVFKDRTFFMVGYERITDKRPRFDLTGTPWVPTEKLRNGDFSDYLAYVKIYDPLTRTGTTTFIGQPFSGNIIPPDRISAISKKILEYYCPPKNPGINPALSPGGNISDATLAERTKAYDTFTARVDQKITDKNRMFGRVSWYERNSHYNDYLGSVASGTLFQFISYQAVVDDVHVFNPTTVLNVRYGYNRFDRNSDMEKEEAIGFDLTKLGFPSQYNTMVTESLRRFPRLDFTGGMVSVAYGNDFRPVASHTVAATLNKSLGAHSLKTGVEVRHYGERSTPTGNAQSGQYAFANTYTRQSSASGSDYEGLQAYATFLLGMPSTTSITRSATYDEYSRTWGFFAQDDWRVNDKLTLNLGLRYEVESALVERDNKSVSGFDYDYVQPIQAAVQAKYAALNDPALKALVSQLSVKGGLKFAGVDGGSGLYTTPKDTFLPRLGFAYQLDPKTIIRGGAGLFAGFLGERRGDVIQPGYTQTTTIATTTNANGAPIPYYWNNALLTTPIIEPVGNANGRQTFVGNSIAFFNPNPRISKQLRGQIGLQRELPGRFVVEAEYVYNYGYDIEINRDINAVPNQYLNTDNSRTTAMNTNNTFLAGSVTNPFYPLLPGTSLSSATVGRTQLLRPYPGFSGSITTTNNDGKSWYQAGQFAVQKRFSGGYTLGLSYTRSKWMQATEYLNSADASPTKMISDLDVTNRMSISGIFAFPFGKGRRFLSEASGIADALVGGWQLQGVYTYQTGFPIVFSTDLFYNGTDPVNGSDIALKSSERSIAKWFNTAVFTSILTDPVSNNSTPVNHLRTLPTRFTEVRRDSINNLDLSLLKTVSFRRGMQLQLRAEFINALNEPYFAAAVVSPTSTTFGQITSSNQANYARRAQLGVKFLF